MATGLTNLQTVDAALAQAIADNTTATQAAVKDIADLSAQLSALNTEDPAVQAIATDLQSKVTALQASTAALQAAVAPPATTSTTPAPVSPSQS